jgi:hypothetical protein
MKKITKEEIDAALELIERYKYQENPTIQVSVTYNAKVDVTVNVPSDWSVEKIKEELEDGGYHGLDRDEPASTTVYNMSELIVNGEVINLNTSATNEDIDVQEFVCDENNKVILKITYNGSGDVVRNLDDAVERYAAGRDYNEFVDVNMDNSWVRIIEIK